MAILTSCWCIDLGIILIGAFIGIYNFYQKKFKHWKKYNIPHSKPKFPFGDLISITTMGENFVLTLDRIYKSFEKEKVGGIWAFFHPILIVRDVEVIKDILVKEFMSFHDRGVPVDEKNDPLSAHLFSISGSKWRNLRAKLTPTFTSGKMKMMFPILVESGREMISILEPNAINKDIVEMKDILARFTTDVIASCAFGIDSNSLKNPDTEFRKMGRKIVEPSFANILRNFSFMAMPTLVKIFKIKLIPEYLANFFMGSVRETMDYREQNNVKRNDFMQLLIQLKNKGKLDDVDEIKEKTDDGNEIKELEVEENRSDQKFSFEEAAAQAFIFFVAGFETSSTTMVLALYELALQPEIQEKVRNEIKTVLGKHNGKITYEAAFGMDYLGNVIDETLRKYPVAGVIIRQCNKDYKIPDSDMVIPKGTSTHIPIYSLHYDSKYFPNPEKFDPDRFTEEVKSQRPRYAYLPFGEGPRHCIGMRFGLMQTRVGLIELLLNYKFEICEKSPVPLKFSSMSFTPKEGMHLRLSKVN
uniref:Cytochrome P450 n=1 Tax=Liposcelis bostrychophila TaxID=185214 RepID=A3RK60_LIPBO|nr:cytochrome P450 [Liposcelis bostrychophila]